MKNPIIVSIFLMTITFFTQAFAETRQDNGRMTLSLLKAAEKNILTVPFDELKNLCGDEDGCEVRLSMNNFGTTTPAHLNAPASTSALFYLNTVSNQWRTSESSPKRGAFGNGSIEHALSLFNTCYLTDGYYKGSTPSGDKNLGLSLMYWPLSESAGCSVTFID